jgi:hypothetical protein
MYYLAITNENGTVSGHLSNTSFDDDLNCFNPLTVFGDMLNVAVENDSFKQTYKQHSFFQNKKLCKKVDEYIEKRKTNKSLHPSDPFYKDFLLINKFLVSCSRIYECFKSQYNISLSEFELIKAMNEFRFSFEISSGIKIENVADSGLNRKYRYIKIDFEHYDIAKHWQEYRDETKDPIRFAYSCNSIEEVLFAVWHYLIFHGYSKFNQCHHCGKIFATTSLKIKYCNDYSPFEKYTHLNCEQAVRNIKQKLVRRKKVVYNNLRNHSFSDDIIWQFQNECSDLNDKVSKCSSVENLKMLEHFLDKRTVREKWYSDENKKLAKMMPND